jgi:hypothetical protein
MFKKKNFSIGHGSLSSGITIKYKTNEQASVVCEEGYQLKYNSNNKIVCRLVLNVFLVTVHNLCLKSRISHINLSYKQQNLVCINTGYVTHRESWPSLTDNFFKSFVLVFSKILLSLVLLTYLILNSVLYFYFLEKKYLPDTWCVVSRTPGTEGMLTRTSCVVGGYKIFCMSDVGTVPISLGWLSTCVKLLVFKCFLLVKFVL